MPGSAPAQNGAPMQYVIPRIPIDRQKYVPVAWQQDLTFVFHCRPRVLVPPQVHGPALSFTMLVSMLRVYICPKKPRHRRKVSELSRTWVCEYPNCGRRYELAHSLSQHIKRKHPGFEQFIGNTSMQPRHLVTDGERLMRP